MKLLIALFILTGCSIDVDIPDSTHRFIHSIELPEQLLEICENLPTEEERVQCLKDIGDTYLDLLSSLNDKEGE